MARNKNLSDLQKYHIKALRAAGFTYSQIQKSFPHMSVQALRKVCYPFLSNARAKLRQDAFAKIEEAGGEDLLRKNISVVRIASIAGTTETYVRAWIASLQEAKAKV